MQVFSATLSQMLVLFVFIALGYFFNKKQLLPSNGTTVLSKLETHLFMPCLTFSTMIKYCTIESLREKGIYAVYGLGIVLVSALLGFFLSKRFVKEQYLRNIYSYSFTVANFGFMGNAVVLGLFGEKVLFDYLIFTLPMSAYVNSFGIAMLTPSKGTKVFTYKSLFNPVSISLIAGIVLGLLGLKLPSFISGAITSAGACMSPVAMLLSGFIIGNYSLKKLASQSKVYLASVLRLLVFPTVFLLVLKAFNTDSELLRMVLCATAMPLGMNTIVFPAAFGGDTTPGAGMALISNIMALITIPIMFTLFL